ncbi:MAG: hypothetical protein H7Y18_03030 [Clostridiaceae bacterium]|nr:hypothetical protein [Clostridiaceae bacterium]
MSKRKKIISLILFLIVSLLIIVPFTHKTPVEKVDLNSGVKAISTKDESIPALALEDDKTKVTVEVAPEIEPQKTTVETKPSNSVTATTKKVETPVVPAKPTNVPKPVVTTLNSKKGVASCKYSGSDLTKLTNLNVGWFYNWTTKYTGNPAQKGKMEYVPMLWGGASVTSSSIEALKQGKQAGQYTNLLAFNEPDLGSQANMTVQQAIDLWPKLMDTGLRLGSPATTTPYNGWLENFMTEANKRGLRVDFIALHFYQDFTDPNAVLNLKNWLIGINNKYKKPIWITEIGTIDINSWGIKTRTVPTQALADEYMKQVLPMLQGLSFVERYSWFTDNCYNDASARYSSLYDNSNMLTSEGKIYQNK